MELAMANDFGAMHFSELNEREMMKIDGGGLGAAIIVGLLTVAGTVGSAIVMPPGSKLKTAGSIAGTGTLLTLDAYQW